MFKRVMITTVALLSIATLSIQSFAERAPRTPELARAQYDTVISRLDTGGDLLIFANIDGLLEELISSACDMMEMIPDQTDESKQIKATLAKLPLFLKKQGFYAIEGIGISSIPRADGLYTTKTFVSRKQEAASTPLWRSMVGLKQRRLTGLDFLPSDTVMASVGANDLKQTWKLVKTGITELAAPATVEGFNQGITMATMVVGQDVEKLIASLGDENFFSLQLSPTATVQIPAGPDQTITIPSPSLLIGIGVSDNTLATVLEASITKTGMPLQKTTVSGSTINTLNLPIPSPVPVSLTFASHNGMLLIGSTQKVVTDAIISYTKKNGLVADAAFIKTFEGLPLKNNGLSYVSQRLSDTIAEVQSKFMASTTTDMDPQQTKMLENMMKMQGFGPSAGVTLNWKSGVLSQGVGSLGGRKLVSGAAVAPIGMIAAIAIPSFVKARTTSQKNSCINNLRQLDSAKEQAAMANNWTNEQEIMPGSTEEEKVLQYIRGTMMPICPDGGSYTLNTIGEVPTCSNPEHSLDF